MAFIGSGAAGGGTLNYRGESYPITIGGLGVGGIGASKLTASGSVYGLQRREDFAGPMFRLAKDGPWASARKRDALAAQQKWRHHETECAAKGLQLSLGADGVVIAFK